MSLQAFRPQTSDIAEKNFMTIAHPYFTDELLYSALTDDGAIIYGVNGERATIKMFADGRVTKNLHQDLVFADADQIFNNGVGELIFFSQNSPMRSFISGDNGDSWTETTITGSIGNSGGNPLNIARNPSTGTLVAFNPTARRYVRSTDDGYTWTEVAQTFTDGDKMIYSNKYGGFLSIKGQSFSLRMNLSPDGVSSSEINADRTLLPDGGNGSVIMSMIERDNGDVIMGLNSSSGDSGGPQLVRMFGLGDNENEILTGYAYRSVNVNTVGGDESRYYVRSMIEFNGHLYLQCTGGIFRERNAGQYDFEPLPRAYTGSGTVRDAMQIMDGRIYAPQSTIINTTLNE